MENRIEIRNYNDVYINDELINSEIFEKELQDYNIEEREETINNLINWISESNNESDKFLMKEDLKHLIKCKDEYLFNSILTNEYILLEDDKTQFDLICKEILELNKK